MYYYNHKDIGFADTENFKIHGRTHSDESGLHLSWSNSGIEFKFKGTRAEISFGDYPGEAQVYVKAYFDGRAQRFGLCAKMPKVLLEFEKDCAHTVKLIRVSEGVVPLKFTGIRIYGKTPEFLAPPAEKKLKLEFLGDSITAGFGNMAVKEQNIMYHFEQDSSQSYAYKTAELLDADIRTVAISGEGVYRNCAKEEGLRFKNIFNMRTREIKEYDHSEWQPDVMVLNCGTNDVPGETTLETMYEEGSLLLDQIRRAYPNAKIVWMYGMMNGKFSDTLKKLIADKRKAGDKNMSYLYVKDIYSQKDEVGAIGHPNVNASVRVSKKLAQHIISISKK